MNNAELAHFNRWDMADTADFNSQLFRPVHREASSKRAAAFVLDGLATLPMIAV